MTTSTIQAPERVEAPQLSTGDVIRVKGTIATIRRISAGSAVMPGQTVLVCSSRSGAAMQPVILGRGDTVERLQASDVSQPAGAVPGRLA
jgi:hypothetical protein